MNLSMFVKKNIKYVLLFILFFFCLHFFYCSVEGDLIYNFGFSYAIFNGEIPYKEFNMIIPPFGAYLYAIPFLLFGSNLLVLNLFQSFLLCFLFYLLFKLFDKKAYLFIPIVCMVIPFPFITGMFAGYNFLLLLEVVLLLYLEKYNFNDYFIGVILGISILTKQTVGFCFCLVSLYYFFKDKKKFLKRLCGFLVPCFIFLIYLIVTGSLVQFFDMCLFGMLDFTSSNGTIIDYNFILFIIGLILVFYKIFKDKKNIMNYYILAFSSVAVPLFDYYHVTLFIFVLLFFFIDKIKIKYKEVTLGFNCFIFALALSLTWFCFFCKFTPNISNFNGFSLRVMSRDFEKEIIKINNFIMKNKDENIIILGSKAYAFKITNGMNINYYDLLNYGNHGYNGTNKIIEMIKCEKNPIFIVNIEEYKDNCSDRQQINKVVMKYVIDNYKEIEKIGEYVIYR